MTVFLFLDDKKIMGVMKRMTRSVITDQIRQKTRDVAINWPGTGTVGFSEFPDGSMTDWPASHMSNCDLDPFMFVEHAVAQTLIATS